MAQHTKGPWSWTGLYVEDSHGMTLALPSGNTMVEVEANGHLMAAAPSLLQWLRLFEKHVEYEIRRSAKTDDDEGRRLKQITLHSIKEAIAAAEGA